MRKDQVVFLDTETTGLDADRHKIWEVGTIHWAGPPTGWQESRWFLRYPDMETDPGINTVLENADPFALQIGHFYERYPTHTPLYHWRRVIEEVIDITTGKHLVGAIPSFDEERLRKLALQAKLLPRWHYHIIDVEALAVGYISAAKEVGSQYEIHLELPWKSEEIFQLINVTPQPEGEEHTALGDARQVKKVFERIVTYED